MIPSNIDLTKVPNKLELVSEEAYFRESWHNLNDIWPKGVSKYTENISYVVFRPDAVAGRRIKDGLNFLIKNGFVPLTARIINWNRYHSREIWRYQWNVASIDRICLSTFINEMSGSLMVFFRHDAELNNVPASVYLNEIKGVAPYTDNSSGMLRYDMKAPNRFLTLVHAPDEPIDIIRELGVFFSYNEQRQLYAELKNEYNNNNAIKVMKLHDRLIADTEFSKLEPDTAWSKVNSLPAAKNSKLVSNLYSSYLARKKATWDSVYPILFEAGTRNWDIITIASNLLVPDVPNKISTISSDGRSFWFNRTTDIPN